ncbi:MAG: hypothetical protein AAGD32_00535 [Planctomycetota bacterium]
MKHATALTTAATVTLGGIFTAATFAAPTYTKADRSVFVSTGDSTDEIVAATDDFSTVDVDVFAESGTGSASFSHATTLNEDSIIGSFAASLTSFGDPEVEPVADGVPLTTGGTTVRIEFTIDTPTAYDLTLFDQTNFGSSTADILDGGRFTSFARLNTATETKFTVVSRSIDDETGISYKPNGGFVGDFDEASQTASGILPPDDYLFLYTIDISAEDAELEFGLEPLILTFSAIDDGDETIIPLPASAWAGLATIGLIGGLGWKKRRRLA